MKKKTYGAVRISRIVCLKCAVKLGHDVYDPLDAQDGGLEGIRSSRLIGLDIKCADCKKPLAPKKTA